MTIYEHSETDYNSKGDNYMTCALSHLINVHHYALYKLDAAKWNGFVQYNDCTYYKINATNRNKGGNKQRIMVNSR